MTNIMVVTIVTQWQKKNNRKETLNYFQIV